MGGKSKSTSSQSLATNPNNGLLTSNYQRASTIADQPTQTYTGQTNATPNANLASAAQGAQGLLGFQAPTVSAGLLSDTDMSKYLNPYEDAVVNSTIADSDHARKLAQLDADGRFHAASAFGGGRQAVYQGVVDSNSTRDLTGAVAQLRKGGWDSATANAIADLNRRLSADQGNQSASIQSAGVQQGAAGLLGNLGQFQTTTDQAGLDRLKAEWLRVQGDPAAKQQLLNQAAGLLYSGPLTESKSSQWQITPPDVKVA